MAKVIYNPTIVHQRVSAEDGGCNFCRRKSDPTVTEFRSTDPERNMVLRICDDCLRQVKEIPTAD